MKKFKIKQINTPIVVQMKPKLKLNNLIMYTSLFNVRIAKLVFPIRIDVAVMELIKNKLYDDVIIYIVERFDIFYECFDYDHEEIDLIIEYKLLSLMVLHKSDFELVLFKPVAKLLQQTKLEKQLGNIDYDKQIDIEKHNIKTNSNIVSTGVHSDYPKPKDRR